MFLEPVSHETLGTQPEPKFPGIVLAAGIIWIVVGSAILLATVLAVLVSVLIRGEGSAESLFLWCWVGVCFSPFGGAFLFVGVQTVRGTAPDTLGNGIGSIIFSGLFGWLDLTQPICWPGLALIVAGVLALVGRSQYKVWRKARKAKLACQLP